MSTADQKIAAIVGPVIEKQIGGLDDRLTLKLQGIEVAIEQLQQTLNAVAAAVEGSTKKVAKDKKPAAADAKTTPVEPFSSNKMTYFKKLYKEDETFRKEYGEIDEAMVAAIDGDKSVQARTKEEQKLIAKSAAAWTYLKKYHKEKLEEFDTKYENDKKAHEDALKPAQQVAETVTPPGEKA